MFITTTILSLLVVAICVMIILEKKRENSELRSRNKELESKLKELRLSELDVLKSESDMRRELIKSTRQNVELRKQVTELQALCDHGKLEIVSNMLGNKITALINKKLKKPPRRSCIECHAEATIFTIRGNYCSSECVTNYNTPKCFVCDNRASRGLMVQHTELPRVLWCSMEHMKISVGCG